MEGLSREVVESLSLEVLGAWFSDGLGTTGFLMDGFSDLKGDFMIKMISCLSLESLHRWHRMWVQYMWVFRFLLWPGIFSAVVVLKRFGRAAAEQAL